MKTWTTTHICPHEYMSKEWSYVVDCIATALKQDNPRFDRVRFNDACHGVK